MSSIKYNSLNYIKYLNNCDLNYKYSLKSIQETPVLKKIIFELPTNNLSNIETTEEEYQSGLLLKCFLACYFINNKIPHINCNKFKNNKIAEQFSNNNHQYSYLQTFDNILEKYQVIFSLLRENDYSNVSFRNLTKLNTHIYTNKQANEFLNFRLEVQAARIVEYRDIFANFFLKIELQNLKLKLNFVFKNVNNKLVSIEEFKNFFLFWNI